jgi:hypothetical protein
VNAKSFEIVQSLAKRSAASKKTSPGCLLSLFNSGGHSVQTASVPGKWNTLVHVLKPFQMGD